jgi:hypothetical protein
LRNVLFREGLAVETLDQLVASEESAQNGGYTTGWSNLFIRPSSVPVTITAPPHGNPTPGPSEGHPHLDSQGAKANNFSFRHSSFGTDQHPDSPAGNGYAGEDGSHKSRNLQQEQPKRTLNFSNLSDQVTVRDILSIVRGGRVLDVYMRRDRSATVTMLEGAENFLHYARRNDFYLHGKRVCHRLNDLPPIPKKKNKKIAQF